MGLAVLYGGISEAELSPSSEARGLHPGQMGWLKAGWVSPFSCRRTEVSLRPFQGHHDPTVTFSPASPEGVDSGGLGRAPTSHANVELGRFFSHPKPTFTRARSVERVVGPVPMGGSALARVPACPCIFCWAALTFSWCQQRQRYE